MIPPQRSRRNTLYTGMHTELFSESCHQHLCTVCSRGSEILLSSFAQPVIWWMSRATLEDGDNIDHCSHVIMIPMDEDWHLNTGIDNLDTDQKRLHGQKKQSWASTRKLCIPEKGGFSEVMVALYFLFFAGDERKSINEEYNQIDQ